MQPSVHWLPEAVSPGVNQPGHEADTHHHLILRLRMSGAIPVIPICVFTTWMGTTLPLFHFLFDFIILSILVLPVSSVLEIRDIS